MITNRVTTVIFKRKEDPTLRENSINAPSVEDIRETGGYDPVFFDHLARIEDKHFWFRARNNLILALVRRISSSLTPCNLMLEVGCGTGNVLRALETACPNCTLVGLELWFEGLKHARSRSHASLIQADLRQLPFGKQFDLIGMFDVLEHIDDDRGTLALVQSNLRLGGKVLLTAPAHQGLWSYFDEAACHCRRYSEKGIRRRLEDAGFEVEFLSQFMASVFPVVWAHRKLNRPGHGVKSAQDRVRDEFRLIPVVNGILTGLLYLEAKWIGRGHSLPIGTSLVVVARKIA